MLNVNPADKIATGAMLNDVELAEYLGVAVQTVRNWRSQGHGPAFVKIGARAVRYKAEAVLAFVSEGEAA